MSKVLITGGSGQMGLAIAQAAKASGHSVALVGQRPLEGRNAAFRATIEQLGDQYVSLNLYDPSEQSRLASLASQSQYWFNCAEPYKDINLQRVEQSARYLYAVANKAGFVSSGADKKMFVRIGSAPPEVLSNEDAGSQRRSKYVEDLPFSKQILSSVHFQSAYFRCKRILLSAAKSAAANGTSVVTVAPTALIGPFGNHHEMEPMPNILLGKPPFNIALPDFAINAVSVECAADGALLAAEKGISGEVYQLSGANTSMGKMVRRAFEEFGAEPLPIVRPPRIAFTLGAWFALRLDDVAEMLPNFNKPWYSDAVFFALAAATRSRNSDKAVNELGYSPSSESEVMESLVRSLEWFSKIGLLPVYK